MMRMMRRWNSFKFCSYPNYKTVQKFESKELKINVWQLEHEGTGAKIYHLANDDSENVFASIVKTFVENNKGAPHILEHLACCGSAKYPIRDPFFNMIKRTVSSYMNAWTGDDFTAYPFASANPKDWSNLYSVYLDTSFRPTLHPLDFAQEGWRYELTDDHAKQLKGIVLNQMKAAYQQSDKHLQRAIATTLYKGTPYQFDSGGTPSEIVNLSYQQLLHLHGLYYHPSNMSFYFYGNQPIAHQLQMLHSQYLSHYDNKVQSYRQEWQPSTVQKHFHTLASHSAQNSNLTVCFLLGDLLNIPPTHLMALRFLTYALVSNCNALAYKQFIQGQIAELIDNSGLNQNKLPTFSLTLKGVSESYTGQSFKESFFQLLQNVVDQGIHPMRMTECINQYEIGIRVPKDINGIKLLEEFIYLMNHKTNLRPYFEFTNIINDAKNILADPNLRKQLINKYFLNNERYVVIKIVPCLQQEQKQISSNIELDDETIKREQQELKRRQQIIPNPQILPTLKISDLTIPQRKQPQLNLVLQKNNKTYRNFHIPIVQDVHFYRLAFKFEYPSAALLSSVKLWAYNVNKGISSGTYDYKELSSKLQSCSRNFKVTFGQGQNDSLLIMFYAQCLNSNVKDYFDILEEMILNPQFELDNTLSIYKSFVNEARQELSETPMDACIGACSGSLNRAQNYIDSYARTKEGVGVVRNQSINQMYQMAHQLLKCNHITFVQHSGCHTPTPQFIHKMLSVVPPTPTPTSFTPTFISKAVTYQHFDVNFCSQQYQGPKCLSNHHAQLTLLLEFLEHEYLHPRIREQGGAYGAGCNVSESGLISLRSYADPFAKQTFDTFDQSVKELLSRDTLNSTQLHSAKISIIGRLDRPKVPQQQAISQIFKNYTAQDIDAFRQYIHQSNPSQILDTGRTFFTSSKSRVIFGKNAPQGFQEQSLKQHL